ncbi:sensor histidine kinase [Pseudactinotalea sp. HY158]|uniref:sensor histidine kinase n=1 Tax=unclassified Pseudactinotalea TaxID=2649176 RepID=UPI001E3EDBCD|nr:sensor histidine kinase [Pseudactinotalea sp. HY158]
MSEASARGGRPEPDQPAAIRWMRAGQHVLTGLLVVIGVIRAGTEGASLPLIVVAALAFTLAYWFPVIARRPHLITTPAWLAVLALVWVGMLAVSSEFMWIAFVLWLLAGQILALRAAVGFSAVVFALVVLAPVLHHGQLAYASVFGPFVGGLFALGISRGYLALVDDVRRREQLVLRLEQAQADMAALHDELALTQRHAGRIAERTRLARDIHDTVAQGLSSISLLARATSAPAADTGRGLAQIESLARDNLEDLRRIIAALTPSELTDQALPGALARLVERFGAETGIDVSLHVDDSVPVLEARAEVALLRTAQSALGNVRRHAKASRVVLTLVDAGDLIRLDVIDDGEGFDIAATGRPRADRSGSTGYGLGFMRGRLRELGGGLDVESTPGEGSAVSAYLPDGRSTR